MCGESSSLWLVPAAVEVNHAFATGARTLLLDALAGESISALRANGIRALLLKGPVTARWLYSDRHPREYVDVDILVASSDFPRTVQMLAELGFREAQPDSSASEITPHARTFVLDGPPLGDRLPAGLPLDLHHGFHGIRVSDEAFWALATEETERIRIAGTEVDVPSEAMRTVLIALHAATSGPFAVQQLADLDRALECLPDETWGAAHDLAMRLDSVPRFVAGLAMRPRGTELIDRLRIDFRTDVPSAMYALGIPPVALGIERLSTTRGFRARIRLVARELIPTPSFMRLWSPLADRGILGLACAYVYRPFWILLKLPVAVRAHRRARQVAERGRVLDLRRRG